MSSRHQISINGRTHAQRKLERKLRTRERKHYTEDCINDEEIEGKRMFSVEEKLLSDQYSAKFVKPMKGEDVCLKYFQENGFLNPIVIHDKAGLGMRLPSKDFTVYDVRQCVGSRRVLDVMDVTTQKDIEMSMKDWVKYYENPHRDKLLNVISLEFSHTKLENYIESPKLVREIDWVDTVWPAYLKQSQIESTNIINNMKYPKVQKYCLMSVKGCYTDFHIDFGGTSVWYHILHGRKVFWLIPPTEENVQLYEQWVLSGKQGDVFFGDTVQECGRIELEEGWTFFIPSGWIHAVYTPEDSLVFGGNFLHSFGIEQQLRIAQVEDNTHVPSKFRYPFYTEMMWYVLARYVYSLLGRSHVSVVVDEEKAEKVKTQNAELNKENEEALITPPDSPQSMNNEPLVPISSFSVGAGASSVVVAERGIASDSGTLRSNPMLRLSQLGEVDADGFEGKENRWNHVGCASGPLDHLQSNAKLTSKFDHPEVKEAVMGNHKHLTKFELSGIKAIVRWLAQLHPNKRNVPEDIKEPSQLLGDIKLLLERHQHDDPKSSVTGRTILCWPDTSKKSKPPKPKAVGGSCVGGKSSSSKSSGGSSKANANSRRRRTRCKKCEACMRADCGECHLCKDMKKFGGPGRMKQSCVSRQCMAVRVLQPVLPHTACCMICGKDGWEKATDINDEEASSLMECSICWEIVHPECLVEKAGLLKDDNVCDDLPNSWECPKCCQNGKGGPVPKLRQIRPNKPKTIDGVQSSLSPSSSAAHGNHEELGTTPKRKDSCLMDNRVSIVDTEAGPSGPLKRKSSFVDCPLWKKGKGCSESDGSNNTESDADDDRLRFSQQITPQKKYLDSGSKKSAVHVGNVKQDGESHVRSCVRQSTVNTFQGMMASVGDLRSSGGPFAQLKSHINSSSSATAPFNPAEDNDGMFGRSKFPNSKSDAVHERLPHPLGGSTEADDTQRIRGLLNCQVKVLKCDEVTPPPTPTKRPPAQPTSVGSVVSSHPLSGVPVHPSMSAPFHHNGAKLPQSPPNPDIKDRALRKPMYVVRPAPILDPKEKPRLSDCGGGGFQNYAMDKDCMLCVFRVLSASDLCRCMLVCRTWNSWCLDRRLWARIDLSQKKITAKHLAGIVRRQPFFLGLSWTNISKKLLAWLMVRLPQLRRLDLSGCSWAAVMALTSCNCPTLKGLELKWVEGMNDARLRDLLSPPHDSRPGLLESKCRLRNLLELRLTGCDVSDVALRYVTQHLRVLNKLDLGHCVKVSDAGIALLTAAGSPVRETLTHLELSGCKRLTDNCLEHLRRCPDLVYLDLRNCPDVSVTACRKFIAQSKQPLLMAESKLIEKQMNYLHHTLQQL